MTCEQLRQEFVRPGGLKLPGVCDECCTRSIAAILSGPQISKEEEIVQEAVQTMSRFQTRRDDRDRLAEYALLMMITEDGQMLPKVPEL